VSHSEDPYSRVDYRRLIAWPERIEREWPFLEAVLTSGPSRRVLDVGCGTGEHARFLASHGFEVVGVDASKSMLGRARQPPPPPNLSFVLGDLADLAELVEGEFGGAICLGNMLPHVRDREALARGFRGLRRRLLPGAPFCFQILNYEKVFAAGQRHLPVNFRPGDGETIVFLRLMDPRPDGSVLFNPTTLTWRPDGVPPVAVASTKSVLLQGWRREELEDLLAEAGFGERRLYGGMQQEPYEPLESPDLVVVAR
jgi:glycine/sarcosine N-methyltransferase